MSRDAHPTETTTDTTHDLLPSHDTAQGRDSTSKTTTPMDPCVPAANQKIKTRLSDLSEARHSPQPRSPQQPAMLLSAGAARPPIDPLRAVAQSGLIYQAGLGLTAPGPALFVPGSGTPIRVRGQGLLSSCIMITPTPTPNATPSPDPKCYS